MEYLDELNDNDAVNLDLIIIHKEKPTVTKNPEKYMTVLQIADKTKTIKARFFGTVSQCTDFYNNISINKVYKIVGSFSEKYNSITINHHELELVTEPDFSKLEKEIRTDPDQVHDLMAFIEKIKDKQIKQILDKVLQRKDLIEKVSCWPAASSYHHAYPGGLITHILEMLRLSESICNEYKNINRDLLFCGCILHDIGKIIEYDVQYSTTFSQKGRLLSHIPIGFFIIGEIIIKETNCSNEMQNHILHMILSHHGDPKTSQSFMPPKTLEAVALHNVDKLSATLAPLNELSVDTKGWKKIKDMEYYFGDEESEQTSNSLGND